MSRGINKNMRLSSMVVKWCNTVMKSQPRKTIVAVVLVAQNAIAAKGLPVTYLRRGEGKTVKSRYNTSGVSNRMLSKAVDTLTKLGLLVSTVGVWGKGNDEENIPSSFMATQTLLDLFPPSEVEFINKTYKQTVETTLLRDGDGVLIDYLDNKYTVSMHTVTSSINTINSLYAYTHQDKNISNDGLVRIFNETFEKGGRYYRSDVQQIKQRDEKGNTLDIQDTRLGLLIDGEPVVECDYGSLHPFLICALHNMDASRFNGDIYSDMLPENYVPADRQLFKLALLFMFNSKTRDSALKAVQKEINFNKGVYSFHYATSVIPRIEQLLPEFSDFFYREDSYGLTLQNIDSRIMEEIMKQFIQKKYPLCPVHDSIVVRAKDEGFAVEAMCKAFRKVVGQENPHFSIKVSRWDGSQSLFKFGAVYFTEKH